MSLDALRGSPVTAHPQRRHVGRILAGCALMFVVLQGGALLLLPRVDLTWTSLIVAAAMLATAFAIERVVVQARCAQAAAALGFGRPDPGAARGGRDHRRGHAGVLPDVLGRDRHAVQPAMPTGSGCCSARSRVNGIAEETLFRGFVFGHLRQAGHSFRRAGLISMADLRRGPPLPVHEQPVRDRGARDAARDRSGIPVRVPLRARGHVDLGRRDRARRGARLAAAGHPGRPGDDGRFDLDPVELGACSWSSRSATTCSGVRTQGRRRSQSAEPDLVAGLAL